jgi:deoxyribonuclease V
MPLGDDESMMPEIPSEWLFPPSLEAAAEVQRLLAQQVSTQDELEPIHRIAGMDVSCNLRDPEKMVYAAIVTLDFPSLEVIDRASVAVQATLAYVPGFLAFREVPALVQAFRQLSQPPDLIMVDGHGISHPRGLGIASHLGVLLNCPTIGVAKSILVGKPQGELDPEPGSFVPLVWKNREIGAVLRTKARTNPLYISTGHRISLTTAISWVMQCSKGYRLPETTRQAHQEANRARQSFSIRPTG